MNKITTFGMPLNGFLSFVFFALFFISSLQAQETYTTIRKNINNLAYDLNHELSSTQDSLLLENKFLFKRVRFIGNRGEKVFDFKPAVMSAKIPLDELPLGKYTVMFYQADKIIVFQIERLLPFDPLHGIQSDVALNNTEMVTDNVYNLDLKFASDNLSVASNDSDTDYESRIEQFTKAYNLSDMNRYNVQTRADYRQNNVRPNGKPYTD
jgi:hypothetical protein